MDTLLDTSISQSSWWLWKPLLHWKIPGRLRACTNKLHQSVNHHFKSFQPEYLHRLGLVCKCGTSKATDTRQRNFHSKLQIKIPSFFFFLLFFSFVQADRLKEKLCSSASTAFSRQGPLHEQQRPRKTKFHCPFNTGFKVVQVKSSAFTGPWGSICGIATSRRKKPTEIQKEKVKAADSCPHSCSGKFKSLK